MLDLLAKRLAEDFLVGTADFCATFMRHLMRFAYAKRWLPVFWDLYIAFDAGQFHHASDPTTVEPCELHTRPMLEAILGRLSPRPTPG